MFKKIFATVIILLLLINFQANSQNISLNNWEVHTTMNTTSTASADSKNRIWVGSAGGIAIFDEQNIATKDTNNLNTILLNVNNGLLNPSINIIKKIPNTEFMLAGTNNGIVELIDENTLNCRHITGIRDHNFSNPRINDFLFLQKNDSTKILIAGGFGIAEYSLERNIFTNTVRTIGDFPRNTSVNNMVIFNDSIWVSTSFGFAKIGLNQQVNIPSNWKTFRFSTPIPEAKIVVLNNKFYTSSSTNIFEFNGENFVSILNSGETINNFDVFDGKIFFSTRNRIRMLENIGAENTLTVHWQDNSTVRGFTVIEHPQIKMVAFYDLLGSAFIESDFSFTVKTPNTPMTNIFRSLALDKNGKLFAVADNAQKHNTATAIFAFDGKTWTNYHPRLLPSYPQNDRLAYVSIAVSPDNKIFAGSWGYGLMIMDENDDTNNNGNNIVFDKKMHNNSALIGHTGYPDWVMTGQIAFDREGRAWVPNLTGDTRENFLVAFNSDGTSIGFNSGVGQNSSRGFTITVDANNTKWIGSHFEGENGLYYFNERGTLENFSDDIWGNLTTSNSSNLLRNWFTSIVYDRFMNTVWLGTNNGVAVINNPGTVLSSDPRLIITANKVLERQHINNIFIDAIGNKWISTTNGIWVISIDGSEVLARFTVDNTPLFSNDIQAVVINPENGLVYIGTAEGLFIANGTVLMPETEYSIKVYPQPFNIRRDREIIIDGLTPDSDIRIITPDGILVRSIRTSSRRAVWNGKDNNDNTVPPGVYLIISSSSVANTSGAGKIAVVE